jgi:hypothetical protein
MGLRMVITPVWELGACEVALPRVLVDKMEVPSVVEVVGDVVTQRYGSRRVMEGEHCSDIVMVPFHAEFCCIGIKFVFTPCP